MSVKSPTVNASGKRTSPSLNIVLFIIVSEINFLIAVECLFKQLTQIMMLSI